MKANYPQRNVAINTLLAFRKKDFVYDFFHYLQSSNPVTPPDNYGEANYKKHIDTQVEWYDRSLNHLLNDILQVISTSHQLAINQYFEELIEYRSWLCVFDESQLKYTFSQWNEETLESYNKWLKEQEDKYFASELRELDNLAEYKSPKNWALLNMLSMARYGMNAEETLINHNFYCIEKNADLLDFDFFDEYIKFLTEITQKFDSLIGKYIDQYERGKLVATGTTYVSTVGQLNSLNTFIEGEGQKQLPDVKKNGYKWNRSDIDCLELITALLELKAITNESGTLTRTEAITVFENLFGMKIKDAESKLSKATIRKKSTHPFLDELVKKFHAYAEKKDALQNQN